MQQRKLTKKEKLHQPAKITKPTVNKIAKSGLLERWLGLIVSLCAIVIYANTLGHGYVLDDYSIILENKITKLGWSGIPTIFKTTYRFGYIFVSDDLYRPVTKSIFAIQWALSPNNPALGHYTNVLVFALTGFILFNTLNLISNGNKLFAFITSLLFISHPIHTEVVANIKSLDELLGFVFGICAVRFIYNYTSNLHLKEFVLAMLFFLLALMSKESSITFLGIFPLTIYLFTNSNKKTQLQIFFSFLTVAISFLLIRKSVTGLAAADLHAGIDNLLVTAPDLAHRFATAVFILGLYAKLFFFPHPLVFDYSFNQIPVIGLTDYRFIVSLCFYLALAVIALYQIKNKTWLCFGILFFFITASISSNLLFLIGTSMGERLMFSPSFGWSVAIGYLISFFSGKQNLLITNTSFFKQNMLAISITSLIFIAFSYKTIIRNLSWKDNYTLYSTDVLASPNSARTHYYLGNYINKEEFTNGKTALEKDSIIKLSIVELKKSVNIYPSFTDAWNQLGLVYDKLEKPDTAILYYQMALKYNPTDPTVHNNIGTVFFKHGVYAEAVKAFEKATQLNPNYAEAFANLGSCQGVLKEYTSAINNFNRAVTIDPNYAQAYYFIGITYRNMGNEQQAKLYLNKAAILDSKFK